MLRFYGSFQRRNSGISRDHLNEVNAVTQFTTEIEENGNLAFPDSLVSRGNNDANDSVQKTDAYRQIHTTTRLHTEPQL